jgi:hypothetical protein
VKRLSTAATAADPPLRYAAHARARRRQDIGVATDSEPLTAAGGQGVVGAGVRVGDELQEEGEEVAPELWVGDELHKEGRWRRR